MEKEIFEIVVDDDILGPLSGKFESFDSANDAAIEASQRTNNIVLNVFNEDSVQDTYIWRDGDWEMEGINNEIIDLVLTEATIHRGCNRAWLQHHPSMLKAGFAPNARYDIEYGANSVILRLNAKGKRKVSATGRGATIDIVNKKMNKYEFSNGINWIITESTIIIMGCE